MHAGAPSAKGWPQTPVTAPPHSAPPGVLTDSTNLMAPWSARSRGIISGYWCSTRSVGNQPPSRVEKKRGVSPSTSSCTCSGLRAGGQAGNVGHAPGVRERSRQSSPTAQAGCAVYSGRWPAPVSAVSPAFQLVLPATALQPAAPQLPAGLLPTPGCNCTTTNAAAVHPLASARTA